MDRVRELVHARDVYRWGYFGRGVRIALLDTGVARHPDLTGRVAFFKDFVRGRREQYDDNGHGTHIAGILCGSGAVSGGRLSGMAPKAELIALKVLDEKGSGSTETSLRALEWIRENQRKYNIRLLNYSMGYQPGVHAADQRRLLDAIDDLWNRDIMIVTAAGNNGPGNRTVTVPGISRKVVTVGASDDRSYRVSHLNPGYSGRGPTDCCIVKPEILAPGTGILSTSSRLGGYVRKSGTSMAVPVVCGALALAFEKDPCLSPALLKLQLYESVDHEREEQVRRCWGILNVDRLIGTL